MPGGFSGTVLETVGTEYESIAFTQEFVAGTLVPLITRRVSPYGKYLTVTHDASSEFRAGIIPTSLGYMPLSKHTSEFSQYFARNMVDEKTYGFELVTSPLHIEQFPFLMYPTMTTLEKFGDFVSDRASVHFHVGFANNLRWLKNMLRISLSIDPILFRLGGMGRTFRGKINRAAYARPLLNSCAVPIYKPVLKNISMSEMEELNGDLIIPAGASTQSSNGISVEELRTFFREHTEKYAQIINPIAALDAHTLEEFWAAFGVVYRFGGGNAKYHASRYTGINFYAIPQHGTIEFRHFNQSTNPVLIVAIARFLRATTELATILTKREASSFEVIPSNDEISVGDAAQVIQKILAMCNEKEIEYLPTERDITLILETINDSKFVPIEPQPVVCHLKDQMVAADLVIKGKLKLFSSVLESKSVDIHNINSQTISIFDKE